MSLRERIVSNIVVTSGVYLIVIEIKHGLVAGLIAPYMPWW